MTNSRSPHPAAVQLYSNCATKIMYSQVSPACIWHSPVHSGWLNISWYPMQQEGDGKQLSADAPAYVSIPIEGVTFQSVENTDVKDHGQFLKSVLWKMSINIYKPEYRLWGDQVYTLKGYNDFQIVFISNPRLIFHFTYLQIDHWAQAWAYFCCIEGARSTVHNQWNKI